ncbi:MAG TPA: tRNA uridine-5-carboxymethylaminomethyl(34) synthesis GTPase MnmE [Syntrophorhabdaceae bacterium]|nr:tRNA uridine-5-carboxymethylaminomethyl(34) synthesis GTPase MnmE [Syntrophorhabdaceae bacterium]
MKTDGDTICAISTPQGEGGIGIIRISGNNALSILKKIFKARGNKRVFSSHRLYLGYIIEPKKKKVIDEVFAVFMAGPKTYTREDVVEIYSHAGYAVQKSILSCIIESGARIAEPGEFTKRAFLNGRIDLLQAESVLDIIKSETDAELETAVNQLKGILSQKLNRIKENIKDALVDVETQIDFSDEDIFIEKKEVLKRLKNIKKDLDAIIESYYEGRAIKNGFNVLILGRTNVGKSSLLNALVMEDKAIVTPIPGTTRDIIEDIIHIKGIKIKLIDTAGIRKPENIVEDLGIEKARQKIEDADLILWILDSSIEYTDEDEEVYRVIKDKNIIAIINKIDLPERIDKGILKQKRLHTIVEISALKNIGLEKLKDTIYKNLMGKTKKRQSILITSLRHRDALIKTREAVTKATENIINEEPLEFVSFELNDALYHLGLITGETCSEEILNTIFERFCIGK